MYVTRDVHAPGLILETNFSRIPRACFTQMLYNTLAGHGTRYVRCVFSDLRHFYHANTPLHSPTPPYEAVTST